MSWGLKCLAQLIDPAKMIEEMLLEQNRVNVETEQAKSDKENNSLAIIGSQGDPSSSSGKQNESLPLLPKVERSTSPGRAPPTLRTTSWSARPIVMLARLP